MKKSHKGSLLAALLVVFLAAACGSGSSPGAPDTSTAAGGDAVADESAPAQDASATETIQIDAEIFISDEGAGCAIYVSVSEAAVTNETNMREMLWRGIVGEDVRSCDFSDVEEVGLITVQSLDEYEQPDWSSVIEHSFFGVSDWPQLVEQCFENPLPQGCDATLDALLTQ